MTEYVEYCQRLSKRLAYLLNGDSEEVESIAYEALGELAIRPDIEISRPLIAQAVRTLVYDQLRRSKRVKRTRVNRLNDRQFDSLKTTENFDDLVQDCTELERDILRLHFQEGYTLGEIANMMQLTERQIGHAKLLAHKRIRKRVMKGA